MKLRQFHRSGFAFYEVGPDSLKITTLFIADFQRHEVLLKDIRIDDRYVIKVNDRSLVLSILVFGIFTWHFGVELFASHFRHWVPTAIFGALTLHAIIVFLFPRPKICIPTKDQGMIRLFARNPSRKKVDDFLYELEGKVKLVACPKEIRYDKTKKI